MGLSKKQIPQPCIFIIEVGLYCLFLLCVVSSISSPFRRLNQADHIAKGQARTQHRELHALLITNSVWVLLRPTEL